MPTVAASRPSPDAPPAQPAVPAHAPLAVELRGTVAESVHLGSVAVVDRDGRLLHAAGDPFFLTMTRSALKPFQAVPFVAAGGPERFGYTGDEVALLCASHSGEPRHVEAAAAMLAKAGNRVDALQCGTHAPQVPRGARRGAAATAVVAAGAQLLGQAQRDARVLHPMRLVAARITSPGTTRCSSGSAAPSRTTQESTRRRCPGASTAARRRTTRCRWRTSRTPTRAWPATRRTPSTASRRARWPTR